MGSQYHHTTSSPSTSYEHTYTYKEPLHPDLGLALIMLLTAIGVCFIKPKRDPNKPPVKMWWQ
jgi:hypothetical protein